MSGAQGAQPPGVTAPTTYESVSGVRARTELRSFEDEGPIPVDKLEDKVEDAAGKGEPVFSAGKDDADADKDENKSDPGVTGTG